MKALVASMLHIDDYNAENTVPKVEWCTKIRSIIRGTNNKPRRSGADVGTDSVTACGAKTLDR